MVPARGSDGKELGELRYSYFYCPYHAFKKEQFIAPEDTRSTDFELSSKLSQGLQPASELQQLRQ
jgi:hypothetical protein